MNVPDDRFLWLVDLYKPKSQVSAFLEVVDIAGLVKCALIWFTAFFLFCYLPIHHGVRKRSVNSVN